MVGVAEGMRVGGWLLKGGGTSFSLNLGVSSLYTFSHENILVIVFVVCDYFTQ